MKQNLQLKIVLGCFLLFGIVSCKKASKQNASMSATIMGTSVSFTTVTRSTSGGVTVIEATSNRFTLDIALSNFTAGTFTLGNQATNNYATLNDNVGESYSTDSKNTGTITLSSGSSGYGGSFSFSANEISPVPGGNNTSVTGGSCSNL